MVAKTPADVEQRIVAAWRDGAKVLAISTRAGVSEWTVRRVLRDHGIEIAPGGIRSYAAARRTTAEQDAEIVRRYLAGESSRALAAEFGLALPSSVVRRVRAAGQPVTPRGKRRTTAT